MKTPVYYSHRLLYPHQSCLQFLMPLPPQRTKLSMLREKSITEEYHNKSKKESVDRQNANVKKPNSRFIKASLKKDFANINQN